MAEIATFFVLPNLFIIIFPFAEFFMNWSMKKLRMWEDRGFTCNKKRTKSKSIGAYVKMISSEDSPLFDCYSFLIVIVLVNMYFGVGLPILFPLTLFAFLSHYIFRRLATVYYFKKSPMMDNKMNKNAIMILKWSVHLYTFAGYWFLTNRQIFYNDVTAK